MAAWTVTTFDAATEQLISEQPIGDLDRAGVRRVWKLPPNAPIGDLPVTADKLRFLNRQLSSAIALAPNELAFLSLRQSAPDEVIAEPDGSTWYPPP